MNDATPGNPWEGLPPEPKPIEFDCKASDFRLTELQKDMLDSTKYWETELITFVKENQHTNDNVTCGAMYHKRSRVHANSTPYSRSRTSPMVHEVVEEVNKNSLKVDSSHPQLLTEDSTSNKFLSFLNITEIRRMMLDTVENSDYQAPSSQQNSGGVLRRVKTRMHMGLPYTRPAADYINKANFHRLETFVRPRIVNSYYKVSNWFSSLLEDFKEFLLIGNVADDPFVLFMKENPSIFNQTN
ncbi:8361_t:CDS:1 [Ambispora leptoticha]|uniref:8361_t:CDS:1 n=1 Tax=Ambispora leptoticha TaxID=144679 RepID=A0A9N8YLK2_9GLOM|nr:8361_t:CDS:1 [Ambispora leptoticha]